jgi:hypothetical protein
VEPLIKDSHLIDTTTMKSVNTSALMLGMLAIGGLIAGGAMFSTGNAYAQTLPGGITVSPVNAASATNSDDDRVDQSNKATIKQKSDTECKASVEDNDVLQALANVNTATNACDTTQTVTNTQANANTDIDLQTATATACQAIGLLTGTNACGNLAAP